MSTLAEFVSATPPPLTLHLVPLAPYVRRLRRLADVVSWAAPWEECALLLALWWALCLFADLTLRFCLPLAALFVLALRHHTAGPPQPAPATEATVLALVDDLAALHALVPRPALPAPAPALLRAVAVLYLPYLALTHLVPLRIVVALAGTLLLVHRARWARNARAALARSAHLRWAYYRVHALLSGTPVPDPPQYVPEARPDEDPSVPRPSPPLRFLFTVYENQRWWVGLDWTAALLPAERPSWCSASQQPLPPPATFSLPPLTTTFVPVGKHGRAKRMARWTWEEPEWRVVVRKEGSQGIWRIEKTPPKDKEAPDDASTAARVLRAARGGGSTEPLDADKKQPSDQGASIVPSSEDDIVTDPDGWVYGDNKWEGASSKGGMGKYTRYRRWTRVAVLSETVELVGPGDFGVVRDSGAFSISTTAPSMVTAPIGSPTASSFSDWESTGSAPEQYKDQKDSTASRSILRQRLKAVAGGSGH